MDRRQSGIRARGNSIALEFSYKGVRCRETIKLPPTAKNLDLVAKKKQAIQYEIATNQFDYARHFPDSKRALQLSDRAGYHVTVKKQLNDWLIVAQKRCQPSSVREYKASISKHLEPEFGHLVLAEFKSGHVQSWISSLNLSGKTINNLLIPLRQAIEQAYVDGLIDSNPMARVKNLKFSTREPDPFSDAEVRKILSNLEGANKNLIQFAFATGLRTSELIALRWEDVDLSAEKVFVRVAIVRGREKAPKTKSGLRTVELDRQSLAALRSQQEFTALMGGRVFLESSDQSLLDDQKIRKKIWKPALKAAGVRYRSPYQTRHTFASHKLMQGRTPFWVAMQMGHSSPNQTFQSYARWITQDAS